MPTNDYKAVSSAIYNNKTWAYGTSAELRSIACRNIDDEEVQHRLLLLAERLEGAADKLVIKVEIALPLDLDLEDERAERIADGLWTSARLVWLLDTETFDHLDDDEHGHWMRQVRLAARDVRATFAHLEDLQ